MSETVNGTTLCEHVLQDERDVTVCSVWCRHHPGGTRDGVICPHAERQCVADHGPAPFLPTDPKRQGERTYANVETREAVENEAQRHYVAGIGTAVRDALRAGIIPGGTEPDDLERLGYPPARPLFPAEVAGSLGEFGTAADHGFMNIVRPTYAQRGAEYGDTWATDGLYDEVARLTDALALVRVKCRRVIGTGGTHRDSVLDLVAYAAAYLAWGDAHEGWWG